MRGLLCIESLYHAIIAGRKTQTRRSGGLDEVNINPDNWFLIEEKRDGSFHFEEKPIGLYKPLLDYFILKPRYRVGEVMYLKEPTSLTRIHEGEEPILFYKFGADKATISALSWSNKLFMPASAARAFIKITSIRCERLLDISNEDCLAEGIEEHPRALFAEAKYRNYGGDVLPIKAKDSFLSLYKFANKVKEVENIWCFVYNFEYLKDYKP